MLIGYNDASVKRRMLLLLCLKLGTLLSKNILHYLRLALSLSEYARRAKIFGLGCVMRSGVVDASDCLDLSSLRSEDLPLKD